MRALDLFRGAGGWSLACQELGVSDDGIEWDAAANATAEAAGFVTVHDDVATFDTGACGYYDGLIASPPCQTFSMAGKGAGRAALETVLLAIKHIAEGEWPAELLTSTGDERTGLVVQPLRYALDLFPEWLAFEQVPTVLPVWEAMADVLRSYGYSTWTGKVHAEQYGTAQTRTRAVLLASATRGVDMPTPTHSRYHSRTPDKLDPGVAKWVSMAECLGWADLELVGFPRRDDGRGAVVINGEAYRARDLRAASEPAQTVTEKERSWDRFNPADVSICMTNPRPNAAVRTADKPAPTVAFGHETPRWLLDRMVEPDEATNRDWPWTRPAPTVVGSFAPDVIAAPGYRKKGDPPRQKTPGSVRVTLDEAARLQDFPASFPFQGTKTKQFQQVGNAIPPRLALACLSEATGLTSARQ